MTQSFSTGKSFPAAKDLVLIYTMGQIYPTSDLSHIIVNPTTLFIGQLLGQMKVKTGQDLGRGLFVCSVFLDVCLLRLGLIVVSKIGEADLPGSDQLYQFYLGQFGSGSEDGIAGYSCR
jgi:hypothetical protein